MLWTIMLEKTLKSPLDCKKIQPVHSKGDQSWVFIWRTDVEAQILWPSDTKKSHLKSDKSHLKRLWCWERLKAEEGDTRGWDDWMASPNQWTWVCVNSGSWWWTERPGVLQSTRSQRVGHNWVADLNWTEKESVKTKFLQKTERIQLILNIQNKVGNYLCREKIKFGGNWINQHLERGKNISSGFYQVLSHFGQSMES